MSRGPRAKLEGHNDSSGDASRAPGNWFQLIASLVRAIFVWGSKKPRWVRGLVCLCLALCGLEAYGQRVEHRSYAEDQYQSLFLPVKARVEGDLALASYEGAVICLPFLKERVAKDRAATQRISVFMNGMPVEEPTVTVADDLAELRLSADLFGFARPDRGVVRLRVFYRARMILEEDVHLAGHEQIHLSTAVTGIRSEDRFEESKSFIRECEDAVHHLDASGRVSVQPAVPIRVTLEADVEETRFDLLVDGKLAPRLNGGGWLVDESVTGTRGPSTHTVDLRYRSSSASRLRKRVTLMRVLDVLGAEASADYRPAWASSSKSDLWKAVVDTSLSVSVSATSKTSDSSCTLSFCEQKIPLERGTYLARYTVMGIGEGSLAIPFPLNAASTVIPASFVGDRRVAFKGAPQVTISGTDVSRSQEQWVRYFYGPVDWLRLTEGGLIEFTRRLEVTHVGDTIAADFTLLANGVEIGRSPLQFESPRYFCPSVRHRGAKDLQVRGLDIAFIPDRRT